MNLDKEQTKCYKVYVQIIFDRNIQRPTILQVFQKIVFGWNSLLGMENYWIPYQLLMSLDYGVVATVI